MKRAFTLIELLVVIAIIAILAAILFPVFAQAKEAAKTTACLSNGKNISLSILLYGNDNEDVVLPSKLFPTTAPIADQVAGAWTKTVQPYLKNEDVLFDPSFSEANNFKAESTHCYGLATTTNNLLPPPTTYGGRNGFFSHYGIASGSIPSTACSTQNSPHQAYAGSGWVSGTWVNRTTTEVVEPARNAIVADAYTAVRKDLTRLSVTFGCEGTFRHKGTGANLGFLDGHSKYIPNDPEFGYIDKDSAGCYYKRYFAWDK